MKSEHNVGLQNTFVNEVEGNAIFGAVMLNPDFVTDKVNVDVREENSFFAVPTNDENLIVVTFEAFYQLEFNVFTNCIATVI